MTEWIRLKTIPDWVDSQYRQYLAEIEDRDWTEFDNAPVTHPERVKFYDRIVYNLEGQEFWSAMGSRYEKLNEWWAQDLPPGTFVNHVEHLLEMAFTISRGVSTLEAMVASERRKHGERLVVLSSKLIEELRELRLLVEAEHPIPQQLARALSNESIEALTSIRDDGDSWAKSHPTVRRPDLNDANSRQFAHGVAEYFGHFYDDKLYAATASLACCVYGSGTVTPSQVREFFRRR